MPACATQVSQLPCRRETGLRARRLEALHANGPADVTSHRREALDWLSNACELRHSLDPTTTRTDAMLIACQYHAEDRLRDGRCVWLRAIRPSDRDLLREGLHHLSLESAYHRFFAAKRELSDGELDYLTQVDFVKHVALVALVDDGSGPLLVGTARYIVEDSQVPPESAEVAFVVEDAHQRLGIGTVLLRHLAAIARAKGLRALHAFVLAENRPMISVFRKSGMPMKTTRSEPGVLEVSLKLVP